MKKASKISFLITIAILLTSVSFAGPDWTNIGGDRLWTNPQNWHTLVAPIAGDTPYIRTDYFDEGQHPLFADGMTGDYFRLVVAGPESTQFVGKVEFTGGSMSLSELWVGFGFVPGAVQGQIDMTGGSITVASVIRLGYYGAYGTLNMSGGQLSLTGTTSSMMLGPEGGRGFVNLSGGTIDIHYLGIYTGGVFTISETGTLIVDDIDGSAAAQMELYAGSGMLVAAPGYTLVIEWNGVDSTTVTVTELSANQASLPVPGNYSVDVESGILSWTAGATALSHNVYLGTNFDEVNNATNPNVLPGRGNQTATTYMATLAPATTYYWRIDEVDGSNTYKGDVWQFTTAALECNPPLAADLTSDCVVDFADFASLADEWMQCTRTLPPCP